MRCEMIRKLLVVIGILLPLLPVTHHSVARAQQQNMEYDQGISAGIRGDFQDARYRLTKAVELDTRSKNDDTFSFLGVMVADDVLRGKTTKEVGSMLCKALQFLPYQESSKDMDRTFIEVGIENALRAIELDPNYATAHLILGFSYAADGNLDPAIAACEKAVAADPNLAAAHAFLSALYRVKKKQDLYDLHLKKALRLINQGAKVPNYLSRRLKNAGLLN
jgi:tetratricopeptide (TPR) repeat protein